MGWSGLEQHDSQGRNNQPSACKIYGRTFHILLFEVRASGRIWGDSVLGTNGRVAAEKGAAAQAEPAAIPAIVGAAVVEPAVNAVGAGVHCIFLAKSVIFLFFPL